MFVLFLVDFFLCQYVLVHQCDTERHAWPCVFHIALLPRLDSESTVKNNSVLIATHNEINLLCTDKLQHDTVCKQSSAVKAAMRQRASRQRTHKQCLHSQFTWNPKVAKKKHENNVRYETQLLHKTRQPQAKSPIQKHENKLKRSVQTRQFVVCYTSIKLKVYPVTFSSRWHCYHLKLYTKNTAGSAAGGLT